MKSPQDKGGSPGTGVGVGGGTGKEGGDEACLLACMPSEDVLSHGVGMMYYLTSSLNRLLPSFPHPLRSLWSCHCARAICLHSLQQYSHSHAHTHTHVHTHSHAHIKKIVVFVHCSSPPLDVSIFGAWNLGRKVYCLNTTFPLSLEFT